MTVAPVTTCVFTLKHLTMPLWAKVAGLPSSSSWRWGFVPVQELYVWILNYFWVLFTEVSNKFFQESGDMICAPWNWSCAFITHDCLMPVQTRPMPAKDLNNLLMCPMSNQISGVYKNTEQVLQILPKPGNTMNSFNKTPISYCIVQSTTTKYSRVSPEQTALQGITL